VDVEQRRDVRASPVVDEQLDTVDEDASLAARDLHVVRDRRGP
jgi:hypothetical protein